MLNVTTTARCAYFAYGLNLDPVGLTRRCPDAIPISTGYLEDYALIFDGVASVEAAPGRRAYGFVWAISSTDLWDSLDHLEGWRPGRKGLYRRERVNVTTPDGEVGAVVYRLNDPGRNPPFSSYLATIATAYVDHGLPLEELALALDESYGP